MTPSAARTLVLLPVLAGLFAAPARAQKTFNSPDEAAGALLAAVESGDYPSFLALAGSRMAPFWCTGDDERDAIDRGRFLDAARRGGIKPEAGPEGTIVLYVGDNREPFPAPLVKTDSGWRFDEDAGAAAVAARHVRRNEIAVMELCLRFREAQFTYLALPRQGGPAFAERIVSTPGRRDGLFWTGRGDDESPLGPGFAAAAFAEQQPDGGARPLFGYYFKVLSAQGPEAPGGALDYRSNGRLRRGFALVAWPAAYSVDGFRTFLINHFGVIYGKDLGPNTAAVAAGMAAFNPDRTWSPLHPEE